MYNPKIELTYTTNFVKQVQETFCKENKKMYRTTNKPPKT